MGNTERETEIEKERDRENIKLCRNKGRLDFREMEKWRKHDKICYIKGHRLITYRHVKATNLLSHISS